MKKSGFLIIIEAAAFGLGVFCLGAGIAINCLPLYSFGAALAATLILS